MSSIEGYTFIFSEQVYMIFGSVIASLWDILLHIAN